MTNQKQISKIIIHLFVWLVLMSMPYLLSLGTDAPNFDRIIKHNLIPLLLFAIVFYANYLYLIDKYLFQRKFFVFIFANMILFFVTILFRQTIIIHLLQYFDIYYQSKQGSSRSLIIYLNTLSLFVPLIFSIALKMGERWSNLENQRKEVENTKLQSEIQHLKYQLQPHFFFNSLNNIYSLVDLSPEKAKVTIHSLGKLMRYLLYESNTEMVELRKEIEFMEKYIELMDLRTSDNVKVSKNFDAQQSQLKVAPLLFISLIENAFKHGISATEKSELHFDLKVEGEAIVFHSKNSNFPKDSEDQSGSGIGLENLKKRLSLLYPNRHQLTISSNQETYQTDLRINTHS